MSLVRVMVKLDCRGTLSDFEIILDNGVMSIWHGTSWDEWNH